ncbi:PLDc N-terminal domain-containing protein [Micromonospora soli]|uniref:PLD nuclease N-terminal domain-containing protein n=1 Tax=Micromonospora sp. NBRC 110009 TaxID=3061627 RepID=UPI00267381B0|nr:PLDc N-terminal domain-containing protein [Micromonospora sp. NBRC 110009]WKT99735.1 PLDc N-terminal domain-containing protein [Micromonospora sp. NBRC 110009]
MVRLYGLLFLAEVVLAICALISCLSAEEGEIRALPRIAWVLIILFFPLVGSIAWFVAGREPGGQRPRTAWPMGNGFSEQDRRRRPVAPDDDPEFLSRLAERSRRDDQELLRRWEEDLRRREEDLRRREGDRDRPEV